MATSTPVILTPYHSHSLHSPFTSPTTAELIHHQAILLEWSIQEYAEGEDWEEYLTLARHRFGVMIQLAAGARKLALDTKCKPLVKSAVV